MMTNNVSGMGHWLAQTRQGGMEGADGADSGEGIAREVKGGNEPRGRDPGPGQGRDVIILVVGESCNPFTTCYLLLATIYDPVTLPIFRFTYEKSPHTSHTHAHTPG